MRGKKIPNSLKRAMSADGIHDSGGRVIPTEPQPVAGVPETPEELTGDALLAWHSFVKDLDGTNVITHADRAALILLSQTWAHMQTAHRNVERDGTIIKFPNGTVGQNPFLKVYNDAAARVQRMFNEFGLTPLSRNKISAAPPEDDEDRDFI